MWKSANGATESFRHDVDGFEPSFGSDEEEGDEFFHLQDENFNAETLIAAYHTVSTAWHRETVVTGRRIPPLLRAITQSRSLALHNFQPLDILRNPAYATSGLRFIPPSTLQAWEFRLKSFVSLDQDESADRQVAQTSSALDNFDGHIEDGILQPLLASSDTVPNVDDRQSRVGDNPTGASLMSLVSEVIPLNRKQRMIVRRVLSEALAWANHPYDSA
jgi:hypothetical protein